MGVIKRETVIAALGFLLLSFVACHPVGTSSAMFSSGGDSVNGYFPLMVRAFQPAHAPLFGPWDATTFTGLPESHHPVGIYYPPTMLFYGLFPAGLAMSLSLVWHHALAGLGAYWLARLWSLSRSAAALAGAVFAFGGFLVWHRCHVPMMQTAAWVPWVLLALEGFRRRGSLLWIVLGATLMTCQALAGHLQMVVYSGVLWMTFLSYFLVVGPGPICGRWRFALGVTAACLLGAMGSLPQNLPMLEVSGWSSYTSTDRSFFGDGCLKLRFLVGLLGRWILGGSDGVPVPGGYSPGEFGLFYGMLPLCLAIFGMVAYTAERRRSPQTNLSPLSPEGSPSEARQARRDSSPTMGFWMVALILNILLMLGKGIELDVILYHVPVYNLFHVCARHICFVGLALALFAAYGLDRLVKSDRAFQWLRKSAALLAGIAVAAVVMLCTMKGWPERPAWHYWGFWIPAASALASLGLLRLVAARHRWLVVVLPALAFLELHWSLADVDIRPTSAASLTQAEEWPEAIRWLHENWHDAGPPRCLLASEWWPDARSGWWTPSAFSSAWGIASMNGYNQSLPRSLIDLLRLNNHGFADVSEALAEERGLSAAGARYFVSRKAPPTIVPGMAAIVDRISKAGSYLIEGSFACSQPIGGEVRAETATREGNKVLAETVIHPDDFAAGTQRFCLFFSMTNDPLVDVNVLPTATPATSPRFRIWKMTETFAPRARTLPPARLAELLASKVSWPFPLRYETADGVRVYENPHARPWATLVREIRPADSDLDAARLARQPGRPVTELAHVVGQPAAAFAPGRVTFDVYAPDRLSMSTDAPGRSFLVLSVTRSRGWTASVDGQPASIHAVDGPFMGVFVPPGAHHVTFRFQPVLYLAGVGVAGCCLGATWLAVIVIVIRKRRARRQVVPSMPQIEWSAKRAA